MYLADFEVIRPQYESSQNKILEWLAAAHSRADAHTSAPAENEKFQSVIRSDLKRYSANEGVIEKRGHIIDDFSHTEWEKMAVYCLSDRAEGKGLQARQQIHHAITDKIFDSFYPQGSAAPDNLIHVSCTGYTSPSSAQKIVSSRCWGETTTVTHAYHMGCYAAIPAIRMASAFSAQSEKATDIVHTEICCLHINPSTHEPDQLVIQSLFADGFVKYSLVPDRKESGSLRILALQEQILPASTAAMTWQLADWGFQFTLKKEIPVLISRHVKSFVSALCRKGGVEESRIKDAVFAIHPGGPKIIDNIQAVFGLSDGQLTFTRDILKRHGNMSSATLPHIWEVLCSEESVPKNALIVSLAFGPGLTIAGALLQKV